MEIKGNASPKFQQFLGELDILLAKYQYKLFPKLDTTKTRIEAIVEFVDDLPAPTVTPPAAPVIEPTVSVPLPENPTPEQVQAAQDKVAAAVEAAK